MAVLAAPVRSLNSTMRGTATAGVLVVVGCGPLWYGESSEVIVVGRKSVEAAEVARGKEGREGGHLVVADVHQRRLGAGHQPRRHGAQLVPGKTNQ